MRITAELQLRGHLNVSYASCVFLESDLASLEAHSPNPSKGPTLSKIPFPNLGFKFQGIS